MPITSSTAPTAALCPSPQKSEIKPIGICLSTNSSIEMPSVATSTVANNSMPMARNIVANAVAPNLNNFLTQNSTVGVVVTKFTPNNNSSGRQQTVILQPRINPTRAALPPQRGPAIISPQPPSGISVRTRVISAPSTTTMPMLNISNVTNAALSSVNSSPATSAVKQVIKGPKLIASASNMETLIMTAPNDGRNIRTTPANNNETKTNMLTVHNMKAVNGPNKSVLPIIGQSKIININNSGQQSASTTKVGIITNATGVAGVHKPGQIFNLVGQSPSSIGKNFILTAPTTSLSGAGGGPVANLVSFSSANFIQPTKISVTPNHHQIIAATTRHSSSSVTSALSQNNLASPKATIYTVATTNANFFSNPSSNSLPPASTTISTIPMNAFNQQNLSTVTISSASVSMAPLVNVNVKPTFLTAASLSPSKPPILTPSSPRPRILSRKRLQSDSPTINKVANGSVLSCNLTTGNIIDLKVPPQQGTVVASVANCVDNPHVNNIIVEKLDASSIVPIASDSNLTPRKKPRKQLLEPSSLSPKKELDDHGDDVVEMELDEQQQQLPPRKTAKIDDKDRLVMLKRPRPTLNQFREQPPKTLPHFLRHSDVRQKPEKKVSITDLLSDAQKQNVGWKVNHMAEQLTKSSEEEIGVLQSRLENFLRVLENDISPFSSCAATTTLFGAPDADKVNLVDRVCVKINDLTRANLQRTKVILDHYNESKKLLLNLTTEHKDKVTTLAKRIGHKRGYIK